MESEELRVESVKCGRETGGESGGWRVESRVQSGKWTMEGKEWREKSREQRVLQLLGIRGPCTHVSAWPRLRSMRSCRPHASTRQFVRDVWSVSISKPYYGTCLFACAQIKRASRSLAKTLVACRLTWMYFCLCFLEVILKLSYFQWSRVEQSRIE